MYPLLVPALYVFTATRLILLTFSNTVVFWYALNVFLFLPFFFFLAAVTVRSIKEIYVSRMNGSSAMSNMYL